MFDHFIGIDYSGAQTADSPLKGLQVFTASYEEVPVAICNPATVGGRFKNWTRRDIANMLADRIGRGDSLLIGIDHGFSLPETYFRRYGLRSWPAFLEDFCRYWPTHEPNCYVDFVREGNWWDGSARPEGQRIGDPSEFRLCERWTSSAKSVFQFDVQGSVAKSTHTGIPWLRFLRSELGDRIHVWPFDGWEIPDEKSVIAEVYPSIFRNRYPRGDRTPDQQDAYAVARWLEETVRRDALRHYLNPPLSPAERKTAELEGWILGVS